MAISDKRKRNERGPDDDGPEDDLQREVEQQRDTFTGADPYSQPIGSRGFGSFVKDSLPGGILGGGSWRDPQRYTNLARIVGGLAGGKTEERRRKPSRPFWVIRANMQWVHGV